MSDQVVIQRRHLRPLYYPSGDAPDFVRYTSPAGNPSMRARDKFDLVRAEHTWHAGPLSQKFLTTQIRWAELKMWLLYYRIRNTKRAEWPKLLCLEDRLACSWYFQSDCISMYMELTIFLHECNESFSSFLLESLPSATLSRDVSLCFSK